MRKFTEEEIKSLLGEFVRGRRVVDICRQHQISTSTFYKWNGRFGQGVQATYLAELHAEQTRLENKRKERRAVLCGKWRRRVKFLFGAVCLSLGIASYPRISDGFTRPEVLFERYKSERLTPQALQKCMIKSAQVVRTGAICWDGWKSRSTGRGTCSHHGGVFQWVYDTLYVKSRGDCYDDELKQCQTDAAERSWVE